MYDSLRPIHTLNNEDDEDDENDDVDADDVDVGSGDGHRSLAGSPSVPPTL